MFRSRHDDSLPLRELYFFHQYLGQIRRRRQSGGPGKLRYLFCQDHPTRRWNPENFGRRHGRELFGNATLLSTGDKAKNGFLALAQWDQPDMGGDGNGYIDGYDLIWNSLLLWVDANHDGVSQVEELSSLSRYHLLSLSLVYEEVEGRDSNGNAHRFQSTFERLVQRRWGSAYVKSGAFHDVYFRIRHEDDAP